MALFGFGTVLLVVALVALRLLFGKLKDTLTGLNDVERLGTPLPGTDRKRRKRVVIVGGSWAGSLAARAMLDHFDEVVVLESEKISTNIVTCDVACEEAVAGSYQKTRVNISQQWQSHGLLAFGRNVFVRLFGKPAVEEVVKRGGWDIDFGSIDMYHFGTVLKPHESGLRTLSISRIFLESLARHMLCADTTRGTESGRVKFMTGCLVKNLLTVKNGDQVKVCGVRVRENGAQEDEDMEADLVVDATGRSQLGRKWLSKIGIEVEEEFFDSKVGYAGMMFKRSPEIQSKLFDTVFMSFDDCRQSSRFVIMNHVEKDHTIVCVVGLGGDYPPSDLPGLIKFVEGGVPRSSEIINYIKIMGEPVSPIHSYRPKGSTRLLYHNITDQLPEGFVAIGDAITCFNPFYGQGLSTSALGVVTLDRVLRQCEVLPSGEANLEGLHKRYFSLVAQRLEGPWTMPKSGDYCYEATIPARGETKKEFTYRFMQEYVSQIFGLANRYPHVRKVLDGSFSMTEFPLNMFMPQVSLLVLLRKLNILS